jgi:hypothetical protein
MEQLPPRIDHPRARRRFQPCRADLADRVPDDQEIGRIGTVGPDVEETPAADYRGLGECGWTGLGFHR